MSLIALGLGLAKYAPKLIDLVKGSGSAAKKVISIAELVTGEPGSKALTAIQSDPKLAAEFQKAVMAQETELLNMAYADRADARDMYEMHSEQTDIIASNIIRFNLMFVFLLVLINAALIYFLKDEAAVLATVSNVLGIVLKSLLDERKDVTGFYFGSSIGSKQKEKR